MSHNSPRRASSHHSRPHRVRGRRLKKTAFSVWFLYPVSELRLRDGEFFLQKKLDISPRMSHNSARRASSPIPGRTEFAVGGSKKRLLGVIFVPRLGVSTSGRGVFFAKKIKKIPIFCQKVLDFIPETGYNTPVNNDKTNQPKQQKNEKLI